MRAEIAGRRGARGVERSVLAILPAALAGSQIGLPPPDGRSTHDFWHSVKFEPVTIPATIKPQNKRWEVGTEACAAWDNSVLAYSGCKVYGKTPYLIGQCKKQGGKDKFFGFVCPQCKNIYTPAAGKEPATQYAWCQY